MAREPNTNEKQNPPASSGFEARMLQARLDFLVAKLSSAVWINPGMTLAWMLPFCGLFPILGSITWLKFAIIMVMQFGISLGAWFIDRGYRLDPTNPERWVHRLAMYQAAAGIGWGIFGWLVWSPGNLLNNALVTMTVVGIIWAYALSRAMHRGVFLAGVVPTMVLALARIITSGGPMAVPLIMTSAISFGLVYVFTSSARNAAEVMMRIRFSNEDLAEALRDTRDDALRKRFEAEAANASKTTFLANMSHELRTPLNAILGFSELIASETLGPVGTARYRDYAKDINSSGIHLLSLINDILDIAKIESGKMEIQPQFVDPRGAIEGALNVIQLRVREKGQDLKVDIDASISGLYTDERAFKQIVINLLSNAVKFTPDGGHIGISLHQLENGDCELCVSDDGPGIAASLLDQIFMPFNQVDNRYCRQAGGTGLGLSLVRGLAQLHGGTAWIDSDTGKGVKAYVVLPAPPREAARRRA